MQLNKSWEKKERKKKEAKVKMNEIKERFFFKWKKMYTWLEKNKTVSSLNVPQQKKNSVRSKLFSNCIWRRHCVSSDILCNHAHAYSAGRTEMAANFFLACHGFQLTPCVFKLYLICFLLIFLGFFYIRPCAFFVYMREYYACMCISMYMYAHAYACMYVFLLVHACERENLAYMCISSVNILIFYSYIYIFLGVSSITILPMDMYVYLFIRACVKANFCIDMTFKCMCIPNFVSM